MQQLSWISIMLLATVASTAHAESYPSELELEHPESRVIASKPGMELEAMKQACPLSMLNASPVTEARNISERILRTQDGVIIETDAEVQSVLMGTARKNVTATYRCEYRDGLLTLGV